MNPSDGSATFIAADLSKEFGTRGIRVNTISQGPVPTDPWLAEDGPAAKGRLRIDGGYVATV